MQLKDRGRAYRTSKGADERIAGIDTLQQIYQLCLAREHEFRGAWERLWTGKTSREGRYRNFANLRTTPTLPRF